MEELGDNFTNKSNGVAFSASNFNLFAVDEFGTPVISRERSIIGSRTKRFELSTADPGKEPNEDEELALGLSLSLPNVKLGIGKNPNRREERKPWRIEADFVESILKGVVFQQIDVVAQMFDEKSEQEMVSLKEFVCDMILNPNSQSELCRLRKALQIRTDITLEVLLRSHRVQLEILVVIKTGVREFLESDSTMSSSDLAEIYLNLRCRNLKCRILLPVDDCTCKFCAQKNGFCRDCMCIVCSKFNMVANTCSWVPCDFCSHRCHTDCGLQEYYFRNGGAATADEAELEFYCVACGHTSKMFDFVKEVFRTRGKDWPTESLLMELNYVRKIFRLVLVLEENNCLR